MCFLYLIGNMQWKRMIIYWKSVIEILLSKEVKCQMNNCSLIGTLILDFIKLGLYHRKIPKVDFLQNKPCVFSCVTKLMHTPYEHLWLT